MNEWHKVSEGYPTKEGRYLVCNHNGIMRIKRFELYTYGEQNKTTMQFDKILDPHFRQGKDVCFWMELPPEPDIDWQKLEELKALEEKRNEINKKIKSLRGELG